MMGQIFLKGLALFCDIWYNEHTFVHLEGG